MEQSTKRLWIPLPYYFFSKPCVKILLREKEGDRLILLYMQLLCLAIQNDGKVIYSQSCPTFTPYTLAISLEGNFTAEEIGKLLPVLKERALVDYDEPEDPKQFKINLTILDFNTDFPLVKDAIAVEREAKLEEQKDDGSSKKKVSKIHHQFTQQLIDSDFITNQDRALPDYDTFFTAMVEKFEKNIGLERMKKGVDEIIAKYTSKVTAKSKWFFRCYENLMNDLRQDQVFSGKKSEKEQPEDKDYGWNIQAGD